MRDSRSRFDKHIYTLTLFCLLALVISSCGQADSNDTSTQSTPQPTQTISQPTQSTLLPTLPVQSSCPAQNTVRPMSTSSSSTTGSRQELVYVDKGDNHMTIKRYEPITRTSISIAQLPPGYNINSALISYDGAWILFTVIPKVGEGEAAIQLDMIRLDGQGFQSLYCGPISPSYFAWSPNMRWVATQGSVLDANMPAPLYFIDLQQGTIQTELFQPYMYLQPFRWLDDIHLYLMQPTVLHPSSGNNGPIASSVFLLDTNKGPNQHMSDLQPIAPVDFSAATASKAQIFLDQSSERCATRQQANCDSQHSQILALNLQGGSVQTVLISKLAIRNVSVVSGKQLLLFVKNSGMASDSIWLVNNDGTDLHQLSSQQTNFRLDNSNPFRQNDPWSLVSRDNQFYLAGTQANGENKDQTYCIGSIQNNQVTITPILYGRDVSPIIAGWTEM